MEPHNLLHVFRDIWILGVLSDACVRMDTSLVNDLFMIFNVSGDGSMSKQEFVFCWNGWIKKVEQKCLNYCHHYFQHMLTRTYEHCPNNHSDCFGKIFGLNNKRDWRRTKPHRTTPTLPSPWPSSICIVVWLICKYKNILYGQSSAKLPVFLLQCHYVIMSPCHI